MFLEKDPCKSCEEGKVVVAQCEERISGLLKTMTSLNVEVKRIIEAFPAIEPFCRPGRIYEEDLFPGLETHKRAKLATSGIRSEAAAPRPKTPFQPVAPIAGSTSTNRNSNSNILPVNPPQTAPAVRGRSRGRPRLSDVRVPVPVERSKVTPAGAFCKECKLEFRTYYLLRKHQEAIHSDLEQLPHVCNQCGRSFKTAMGLHRHQLVHSNNRKRSLRS